jgi:hypothetical protein
MATPIEARPARNLLIARTLHSLVETQLSQLRGIGSFPPGNPVGQCATAGMDVRPTLAFCRYGVCQVDLGVERSAAPSPAGWVLRAWLIRFAILSTAKSRDGIMGNVSRTQR